MKKQPTAIVSAEPTNKGNPDASNESSGTEVLKAKIIDALSKVDQLKTLPLDDLEPAVQFAPTRSRDNA